MKAYFAPMEGITGYVFRRAHHAVYGGVDRYFGPFVAPGASHVFSPREKQDVLPAHNGKIPFVPQVLTSRSEDFLWAAKELWSLGYEEINLNLGCPSGTVTAKGKGAGFLGDREKLRRFLEEVFEGMQADQSGGSISVKTRVGLSSPEEFPELLHIFNQYPIKELTIHPRVREDYYRGPVRMESFRLGMEKSRAPVCYNGDLFSVQRVREICRETGVKAIMAGRGAVASPWMFEELQGEEDRASGNVAAAGFGAACGDAELSRFMEFHGLLLEGYEGIMSGDKNVLFKMKELWHYFGCHFPGCDRELKKVKKAQRISEYQAAVKAIVESGHFTKDWIWEE